MCYISHIIETMMEREQDGNKFVRQNQILKNSIVEKGERNYKKEWGMGGGINEKQTIIQRPKLNNK